MCTSFVLLCLLFISPVNAMQLHCFHSFVCFAMHLKITTEKEIRWKLLIYFFLTFQTEDLYIDQVIVHSLSKQSGSIIGVELLEFHFISCWICHWISHSVVESVYCWNSTGKRSIDKRDREEGINRENQKSVEPFGQVASEWQWIPYIGNGTTHTSNPFVQQSNYCAVCATTNELLM